VCTSPQALRRPLEIVVRQRIWPSCRRRCPHLRKWKDIFTYIEYTYVYVYSDVQMYIDICAPLGRRRCAPQTAHERLTLSYPNTHTHTHKHTHAQVNQIPDTVRCSGIDERGERERAGARARAARERDIYIYIYERGEREKIYIVQ
jgi:hypothetical protein